MARPLSMLRGRASQRAGPLLARLPLVGVLALVAAGARLATPAPPEATEEGVAGLLAAAGQADVAADAFVWEQSRGWLIDSLVGRRVLFLAGTEAGPRDLHRATVRVTREGRPLSARGIHNLTGTALGDEHGLVAFGHRAAFLTRYEGSLTGLTVLDLRGAPLPDPFLDGLGSAWSRWEEVGDPRGLGRVELAFRAGLSSAKLQWLPGELRIALGDPPVPASLSFEPPSIAAEETGFVAALWTPAGVTGPPESVRRALERIGLASGRQLSPAEPAAELPAPATGAGWPPAAPAGASWAELAEGIVLGTAEREGGMVSLVALDTRTLDVGYRAGNRFPRAQTGPAGSGKVPENAVAVFNGADEGGGAIEDRRVLAPMTPGEPAIATDGLGRLRLGRWSDGAVVASARQTGAPLVEGGRRAAQPQVAGARSAIGRTAEGHLIYGFTQGSAHGLATALVEAGCVFAVPLRTGNGTVGFALRDAAPPTGMGHPAPQSSASHGFFYVTSRRKSPQLGELAWTPSDGPQPGPDGWPALHRATTEALGAEVTLLHVQHERLRWEIEPGTKENAAQTTSLALDDATWSKGVLTVALGLAHRKENRRGLAIDGAQTLPIRPFLGTLEVPPSGGIAITYSVEGLAPDGDATELPLLAEGGRLRRRTKLLGAYRARAAACIAPDGALVLATATHDNGEPVAEALLDLGCLRVVELNRGRQVNAFVKHGPALSERPRQTVLVGLLGPARGRAGTL